ncbi:hypothetical protein [Nocardiopsis suaedae]|uniref:Uncharacterized protein n=1 Tax=Nocardiopsis suaedae TaxID=3018444 RepID=A0ABT4TIN3_9ACTN|nr:hypothetical protein [Nocardiopsis suaedae]MDA2804563.1 hypothetical protein [Nocardiopsis suaedae]
MTRAKRSPRGAPWRIRLRAALAMADAALLELLDLIAAALDRRPASVALPALARRLSSSWNYHLQTARIRAYGPGRGLLAVIVRTTPASPDRKDRA